MVELLIGGVVLYFGYYFVQGYIQAYKARGKPNRATRHYDDRPNGDPLPEGFHRHESAPKVIVDGIEIKTSSGAALTLPFKVTSTLVIERDEVFADLNRQATQARSDGDMDKAVALLQQAKQRQGDSYEDTRLALYLQHAGRFDEAMAEFEWLLHRLEQRVENDMAHTTPTRRKAFVSYGRHVIHDKARLASEREGRSDLAQFHGQLADQYEKEERKQRAAADRVERRASERRRDTKPRERKAS